MLCFIRMFVQKLKYYSRRCHPVKIFVIISIVVVWMMHNFIFNQSVGCSHEKGEHDQKAEIFHRLLGPIAAGEPKLIELIRRHYLFSPSARFVPYNLRHETKSYNYNNRFKFANPSWILIDSLLKDFYPSNSSSSGFFIEAGAYDGEYLSNTLRIEREQGWTGLLVEPNSDVLDKLLKSNRKAWISPTCLSLHSYPERVVMRKYIESDSHRRADLLQRSAAEIVRNSMMIQKDLRDHIILYETAQCVPLLSLLLALNISHVDFFSVDVEQVEEQILDTFPLETITIDFMAIEHRRDELTQKMESEELSHFTLEELIKKNYSDEVIHMRRQLITEFEDQRFIQKMISRGYYYLDSTCAYVNDYIFVRKASILFEKLKVPRNQENRTEVCKFKLLHSRLSKTYYKIADLRDPHHYPNIVYKDYSATVQSKHRQFYAHEN